MVDRALTESQILRLEKMFRQAFGRDLTPEERRFLGFSVLAAPPADDEDEDDPPLSRKASA